MENKIYYKLGITLFLTLFLNLSFAQSPEISVNTDEMHNNSDGYSTDEYTKNGYWVLSDTKVEIESQERRTIWSQNGNELIASTKWLDILNIEHSVISNFKWPKHYKELKPDAELTFKGIYKNIEYNTTAQLKTGVEITLDYNYEINNSRIIETFDISKSGRHLLNLTPDLINGYFRVPVYTHFDILQINVRCYVGKDSYTTTYIYNWVNLK